MTQNISSEHGDDYDDEYFSDEEVQCHMDRLEWAQARLVGEVGRTCPPFYDRQELQQYIFYIQLFIYIQLFNYLFISHKWEGSFGETESFFFLLAHLNMLNTFPIILKHSLETQVSIFFANKVHIYVL